MVEIKRAVGRFSFRETQTEDESKRARLKRPSNAYQRITNSLIIHFSSKFLNEIAFKRVDSRFYLNGTGINHEKDRRRIGLFLMRPIK